MGRGGGGGALWGLKPPYFWWSPPLSPPPKILYQYYCRLKVCFVLEIEFCVLKKLEPPHQKTSSYAAGVVGGDESMGGRKGSWL